MIELVDKHKEAVTKFVTPLNSSTERFLRPARVEKGDTLFLWVANNGKDFMYDLRHMRKVSAGIKTQADAGPLFACVEIPVPERWEESKSSWSLSYSAEQFVQRVPEHKRISRDEPHRYQVAGTDVTALLIYHGWPQDQIQFRPPGLNEDGSWRFPESKMARTMYELLIQQFLGQTERALRIAKFKEEAKFESKEPKNWVDRNDRPLADYQKLAVWEGPLSPLNLAVFADRGTGKTPIGVAGSCHLGRAKRMEKGEMARILVICPGQVRTNWQVEFSRFATVPGKATVVKGTAMERLKRLIHALTPEDDCAFSAAIISYDSAASETTEEALLKVPWDLVILDESHKYKSSSTKRWKTIEKLRHVAQRMLPMTGTPIGNSPMDLWTQLESLGPGMSGFRTFKAFAKFYGKWEEVGGQRGIMRLTSLKNIPLLQERLARCSFSITKAEAGLKLPDKVYDYYEVDWSPYHRDFYARVEKEIELEIENQLSGEVTNLTVQNILTRLLRLAQITSGHIRWDPKIDPDTGIELEAGRLEQIVSPNPKVEGVIEMLKDEERDPNGKTVVWCCFRPDIAALMARFKEEGIDAVSYFGDTSEADREEAVRRYNSDPNCRVIVCNPKTAGEGLNLLGYDWWNEDKAELPTYTDHEIFFSCNWSALERDQAEDRAHRRGTRSHVRITDLVIPGTIDVEIRERVKAKIDMATTTLDIREVLKGVLGMEAKYGKTG